MTSSGGGFPIRPQPAPADFSWDVAVIGGGIAGLSLAAELSAERRVIVLEREPELGYHATSRSAAAFLPSYGAPHVRALTEASAAIYADLSAEHGSALLHPRPLLAVATTATGEAGVAHLLAGALTMERVSPESAVSFCPALRPDLLRAAAVDQSGMDIDVAGLQDTYERRIKHNRGVILRRSGVRSITRDGEGWRLAAGEVLVRAGLVVNAAGAWADEVAQLAGAPRIGLQPKRRSAFVSRTAHPGGASPTWPLVYDAQGRYYFKPEGDAVLISPAEETPSGPGDARADDLQVARAIEAVNDTTTLGVRSVVRSWAGLRSSVPDDEPVVGELAEAPGFFYYAGQSGYGVQMAPALAGLAASLILGRVMRVGETRAEDIAPSRLPLRPVF